MFLAKSLSGFKSEVDTSTREKIIRENGGVIINVTDYPGPQFTDAYRIRIFKGKTVEQMIEIFKKLPGVEYAEPNYLYYAD